MRSLELPMIPILSVIFLYLLSAPLYVFPHRAFYPMVIIIQSLAYIILFNYWAFIVYIATYIACLPGLYNVHYIVLLIPTYNFIAYILGGLIGRNVKERLLSVAFFWLSVQISNIIVRILVAVFGGEASFSTHYLLPNILDAPFYFIAYLILAVLHLAMLKKLGINVRPWISRLVAPT